MNYGKVKAEIGKAESRNRGEHQEGWELKAENSVEPTPRSKGEIGKAESRNRRTDWGKMLKAES